MQQTILEICQFRVSHVIQEELLSILFAFVLGPMLLTEVELNISHNLDRHVVLSFIISMAVLLLVE